MRRIAGWIFVIGGTLQMGFWVGVPLTSPPPAPGCQPVDGVLRGVYHVHPFGHDDRDRSERVLPAAEEHCLDFVFLTNHHALPSAILRGSPSDSRPILMDGSEWSIEGRRHHGQLAGAYDELDWGGRTVSHARVLNHPTWSGLGDGTDLSGAEVELAQERALLIEARNVTRLLKTPDWSAGVLGVLAGPGRPDLLLGALSVPGPDSAFWRSVRNEVGMAVPMVCGTDAHGGLTDYRELFGAGVLHVAAPPPGVETDPNWIVGELLAGRGLCVNEHFGSPGVVSVRGVDCGVAVESSLPDGSEWRVVSESGAYEAGSGSALVPLSQPGSYHLEVWSDVSFGLLGSHARLWAMGLVVDVKCIEAP